MVQASDEVVRNASGGEAAAYLKAVAYGWLIVSGVIVVCVCLMGVLLAPVWIVSFAGAVRGHEYHWSVHVITELLVVAVFAVLICYYDRRARGLYDEDEPWCESDL